MENIFVDVDKLKNTDVPNLVEINGEKSLFYYLTTTLKFSSNGSI